MKLSSKAQIDVIHRKVKYKKLSKKKIKLHSIRRHLIIPLKIVYAQPILCSVHAGDTMNWLRVFELHRSDLYGVAEHLLLRVLDCAIPVVAIYRQVPPLTQDQT